MEQEKIPKIIMLQADYDSKEQVISGLANKLREKDIVKADFANAVVNREKDFPTGLPAGEINIAIPHTSADHVNSSAIAVATLKHPVLFHHMVEKEKELPISIVMMLAINSPNEHIDLLKKIINLAQSQDAMAEMLHASEEEQVLTILDKYLD